MVDMARRNAHSELTVRPAQASDLASVAALHAELTGGDEPSQGESVFERFLHDKGCIALAVVGDDGLHGYLFGEVRTFEFGSDACGWILALGVRPETARKGRASALLDEARTRFRAMGVRSLRTMVTRTDVPFLSLFRRHGFVGGPFVQLELDIDEVTK